MMRLVFIGPPGAGKGTQAHHVCEALAIPHISTGDLLRSAVEAGTDLGRKAKEFMDAGQLVPNDLILDMMTEALGQASSGFLLDGYPRNADQKAALDGILSKLEQQLDRVIFLDLADEIIVQRSEDRRICRGCGAIYNISSLPPQNEDTCDRCGGHDLYQRDDDRREVMVDRLKVYREETAPLLEQYTQQDLLVKIDGNGPLEDVRNRLMTALGQGEAGA